MPTLIPNAIQGVQTLLDLVSDCLYCARVLRQRDAFLSLWQPIVFQLAENMTGEKQNKVLKHGFKTSMLSSRGEENKMLKACAWPNVLF